MEQNLKKEVFKQEFAELGGESHIIKRVYIRGCPRSGNTLMLYLCRYGFKNTHILESQEIPVPEKSISEKITFGTFPSPEGHKQKRIWAENFLDKEDAAIIFMVRDPRDVLLSEHGLRPGKPWINNPQRWIDNALLFLELKSWENHPRIVAVRFEDLLTKPNEIQVKLANSLGLEIDIPFSECWQHFQVLIPNNMKSLKTVRPFDPSRIGSWKSDLVKKAEITQKLSSKPEIYSLMKYFGYDSSDLKKNNSLQTKSSSVPLLTEKAILFLENFFKQNPNAKVLEFGSGNSTIWMSKLAKNIVSIEHDLKWYERVKNSIQTSSNSNPVDLRLLPRPYYTVCEEFEAELFDLIIVDGRDRVKCFESSMRILKKGGILMLDDAQRISYNRVYDLVDGWHFTKTTSPERDTYWWRKPGINRAETKYIGLGLSWENVLKMIPIRLYAGNLTEYAKKDGCIGLSYKNSDKYHVYQDLTKPIPIPDNVVDAFQSEDVFEHIQVWDLLKITFPEIYRIMKPGGLIRISVPDYRCNVLANRSWKDDSGIPYFDPTMGGTWDEKKKHLVGRGHVWLPTYEKLKALIDLSPLSFCQAYWLHYYDIEGQAVLNEIDYSKGYISRTPDHDSRVGNPRRPLSIVVDLYK